MIPLKDDVPSRTFPVVTVLLIVLNLLVFLVDLSLNGALGSKFAMRPALVTHYPTALIRGTGVPVWATLFTMMFLHGGWMHIGGNMLYLWIFGNNTEDTLGHWRYLVFYFVCGLLAEAMQIALSWNSLVPTIGASGAIAGVLGAYFYLFPDARVTTLLTLFFIWPIVQILGPGRARLLVPVQPVGDTRERRGKPVPRYPGERRRRLRRPRGGVRGRLGAHPRAGGGRPLGWPALRPAPALLRR